MLNDFWQNHNLCLQLFYINTSGLHLKAEINQCEYLTVYRYKGFIMVYYEYTALHWEILQGYITTDYGLLPQALEESWMFTHIYIQTF